MPTDTSMGKTHFFDDFLADTINLDFYTLNSDTGGTNFATSAQRNGAVRGSVDTTDNDITNLFAALNYRADSGGPTTMEVRMVTRTSVADGETYVGWTDDSAADEMPLTLSTTDVVTSTATDLAGFAYTGAGTASWKCVATRNDVDATVATANVGGATTPVVGTYQTFKVVLNEDGDAYYYLNGIFQTRIASAIRATVDLTVCVGLQSGGTARDVDIDYIDIWTGRI